MTNPVFTRLSSIVHVAVRQARGRPAEPTTDTLTGLANRRHLLRLADRAIGKAVRQPGSCAILLVELQQLRAVNGMFGHAAGDAVLVAVAQRLALELPTVHVAGRLGGDRFAVLLGPEADLKIEYCAEQLAARLARPVSYAGAEIRIGAAIGIAMAPDDGISANGLIAAADERMQFRKGRGSRMEVAAAA